MRGDALRDSLTGLLNRRGLMEELQVRPKREVGTIAVCDVDHFKAVNDGHGHAVGDRVLKGVAASLAESVGAHQVARWGGEEFVVLLDGVKLADARVLLERARRDLQARSFKLLETGEQLAPVTISIDVASLNNVTPEVAIEGADRLLYEAKR